MKKRIWELDAFRGICVLGMLIVHFVYDLTELYRLVSWQPGDTFAWVQRWGGVLFLLLSGICVTLGRRSIRRGLIVFGCGLVCTAVTVGMYRLGLSGNGIQIYFGVLHCLGICMLLWPTYKTSPWWALLLHGVVLAGLGLYLDNLIMDQALSTTDQWLMPLGLYWRGFQSSDYFPLLPNLGYFLVGAAIGKTVYGKKESLLPKINHRNIILRCLQFCGRHSLWIYLLHQPILSGICMLLKQGGY
jgi:uncharacterized membrane protein